MKNNFIALLLLIGLTGNLHAQQILAEEPTRQDVKLTGKQVSNVPDFSISYSKLSAINIEPYEPLSISVSVEDINESTFNASVPIKLYYSLDQILDSDDFLANTLSTSLDDTISVEISFPANEKEDGEGFIICVVDPDNDINEDGVEENNTSALGFFVIENPFNQEFKIVEPFNSLSSPHSESESLAVSAKSVGDIDLDGKEDLVVLYNHSFILYTNALQNSLEYFFEEGETSNGQQLGISHINDDTNPDLYVVYRGGEQSEIKIAIFYGGADITNQALTPDTIVNVSQNLESFYPDHILSFINAINVGDIDGDNFDDLVIPTFGSSQTVIVYGGTEKFGERISNFDISTNPSFTPRVCGLGDINGDAIDDFTISDMNNNIIHVYFGSSNISKLESSDQTISFGDLGLNGYSNTMYFGYKLVAGNFNGDDLNDVIVMPLAFNGDGESASSLLGMEGLFLFTGSSSGLTYKKAIRIPAFPFGLEDRFFSQRSVGDLFLLEDSDGNGFDEIVFTSSPSYQQEEVNALVLDTEQFNEENLSGVILQSPNVGRIGFDQNSIGYQLSNAVGDFDNDGQDEIMLAEYRMNTLYSFSISQSDFPLSIYLERFKIYPNPAQDYISIDGSEHNAIDIINAQGKLVMEISDATGKVDIRQLEPGIYFVKVGNQISRIIKK